MGLVKMRKSQRQLTYMEGKPTVYQLRQLIYAPIKEKDLIKYISQSANVPESTIEAAILGLPRIRRLLVFTQGEDGKDPRGTEDQGRDPLTRPPLLTQRGTPPGHRRLRHHYRGRWCVRKPVMRGRSAQN